MRSIAESDTGEPGRKGPILAREGPSRDCSALTRDPDPNPDPGQEAELTGVIRAGERFLDQTCEFDCDCDVDSDTDRVTSDV